MRSTQLDVPATESAPAKPWADEVVILPTTLAQQRFWSYDRETPGDPAYNIAVRMRLKGSLDVATLERATNEIIRRHEMLRTVFASRDGEPVQLIAPELVIPLTRIDLQGLPVEERHAHSEDFAAREARTRFNLYAGPLIRFVLLQLEPAEHILMVTVHQTVSDCWSLGIISHEIGVLYNAFFLGQASPLPELPIQYGDYAIWQKQSIHSLGLDDQLAYWTRQLADLPLLEVPTDRPRPAKKTSNGQIDSILLPKPLTEALKDVSHREGCTFFMLSLAALKLMLRHLTGQSDIFVGTITAGRTRVDLEPLIGRFINPLVVRTDLSGDPTFLELLANVRERVLEALDNRDIPYESVIEALKPAPDPSRHPLFQINFVHQRAFVRPLQLSSVSLSGIPSKSAGAIYDLYFFMVERAEGWRLSCEYNTDLYEPSTVERMLSHLRSILEGIAADPTRPSSDLCSFVASDSSTVSSAPTKVAVAPRVFVAPRDEVEAKLAKIWCEVIQTDRISVTSDFFDEGGHSVLAARVLYRVERAFGRELSLGAFLRAPTIEKFALRLREDCAEEQREQVCVIQPGASKPPLFLVDAGYSFLAMAEAIGEDRPVYGLIMPPITDLPQPFTVEDIAENLLRALVKAQPHGPYYLGGWCSAGIVAYEIAQRLRARGEEVGFVALFDAWNPVYSRRLKALAAAPRRIGISLHKMRYRTREAKNLNPSGLIKYMSERVVAIRDQWRMKLWRLWYRRLKRPAGAKVRHMGQFKNIAALDYRPDRLDAPLVLFRAEMYQGCSLLDSRCGWGDVAAAGLTVHDIGGDHGAMLFDEPYVRQLGAKLAAHLECGAVAVH